MIHKINILLKTIYDSTPAHLQVFIKGKNIYNDLLKKDIELTHSYDDDDDFLLIKIIKTGKNLELVKKNHQQIVTIKKLHLNNFNIYPDKFGKYYQIDNPYVKDSCLQTDCLALNGEWVFNIPLFKLKGISALETNLKFRDNVVNSDISCFGCSFTWGGLLENNHTWPWYLSLLTGKNVKNYGIGGSNNPEILSTTLDYVNKYQTNNVFILLCHFCRLQLKKLNKIYSWHPHSEKHICELFPDEIKKMVKYSETELLIAGQVPDFYEIIKNIKKKITGNIYISTYIKDHYECLKKLKNDDFILLPFYELSKEYKMARDGLHPGPEHNRLFAESVVKYLK